MSWITTSYVALNYLVIRFYTYSVKKNSFIIEIYQFRKREISIKVFFNLGKTEGGDERITEFLLELTRFKFHLERACLSSMLLLLPFSPPHEQGILSFLPSVQTAVQDRLFWIYWFIHKLITLQQEYSRLNYPIHVGYCERK